MTDHYIEDKTNKVDLDLEKLKGKVNFNDLKSGGFIKQRQKDLFTVRLRCPGGRMTTEKLVEISKLAEKYSKEGVVHFSYRQSLEILYVDYKDFHALVAELEKIGQKVASCGPRVRVPTACGGCEYNPNGLIDAQAMARMVDEKYFGTETPHKFKTSFSGCPIDCSRTVEMDLGFQGVVDPEWVQDLCTGCTICAEACKEGAIVAHPDTGEPIFNVNKCLYCADCIRACPTEAWVPRRHGFMVRIGGKHGRHPLEGVEVCRFLPEEKVSDAIDMTVKWYQANGNSFERIGSVLQRLGMEGYMKHMAPVFGDMAVVPEHPPTDRPLIDLED